MSVRFETFSRASSIDPQLWNRFAQLSSPLMEWEYFTALEESQSVGPERGYYPSHIVAHWNGEPAALAPLYERDRSWVEFGDGGLVQFLSELTRIPYQRGLVGTLPFTPVPAYEFLYADNVDVPWMTRQLLNYVDYLCETRNLYTSRLYFFSPHIPEVHSILRSQGYLTFKTGYSLWYNQGYRAFEDFLATFKSARRTKIRREIKTIKRSGMEMKMISGLDASDKLFETMGELYLRTWRKHMGLEIPPFLRSEFFEHLQKSYRHRVNFCVAGHQNAPHNAMALFYHKDRTLYGRYWGCIEEVPFLHFVLCYYYPIQYAIEHGFSVMDPGFGGEHKLIRGFEVFPVHHYIKFHGERERQVARNVLRKMHMQPHYFS